MVTNSTLIPQQNIWHTKIAHIAIGSWILCILIEIAIGIFAGIIPSMAQPEVWIAGLVLLGYFGIALVRPQIAFGIFLFFFPLVNTELRFIYHGKTYFILLFQPLFAILITIALLVRIAAKLHQPQSNRIFLIVPLFLLGFWSFITTFWAQDKIMAWFITLHLPIMTTFIFVLFQLIDSEKKLKQALWIVLCGGLITATAIILSTILSKAYQYDYTLAQFTELKVFLSSYFEVMGKSLRATGFGVHNKMALLMTFHLFLAGALFTITPSRKGKIFLALMMLYMLYADVLTKSRAPLLGLLLGSLVALILLRTRVNWLRYKTIVIYATIISLIVILLTISILSQFEKGVGRFIPSDISGKETAFSLRFTWVQQSLEAFLDTYGFGIGAGNIYRVLSRMSASLPTPHSHNLYVHVLSELGIIGGIILAGMLYSIIRNIARALNKKGLSSELSRSIPIFTGALAMLGVACITDNSYYMIELWLYVALILAPINLALQPKQIVGSNQSAVDG